MRPTTYRKVALACLLYGAASQAAQADAANYLTNPGAEDGLAPWTTFGGGPALRLSNEAHDGAQSLLMSGRTAFYHGPSYDLKPLADGGPLIEGKRYQASVWVRHTQATEQTLYLNVKKVDGSGTDYHTIASRSIQPGVWTQITGFYVPEINGVLSTLNLLPPVNSFANGIHLEHCTLPTTALLSTQLHPYLSGVVCPPLPV